MAKLPNEDLHGTEITGGTVIVLSFSFILMIVLIVMGVKVDLPVLFYVGPSFFVVGTLLCLPNLKNWVKGKIKEHRIRTGKEIVQPKKTWNPNHRFDD
ncbi:MAG: hypothetical protein IIV79_01790 [Clostridia bacterium]|nr:hypothetical protein [Clostridia bacterium]